MRRFKSARLLQFARTGAALALLAFADKPASSMAMNCFDDAVGQVSKTGSVLEMLSGRIYEVEDLGQIHTSLWRSSQRVWICAQRNGRYQIPRWSLKTGQ